ncbi:MAG: glycosyltransferase [Sumerlaeia bacterium]
MRIVFLGLSITSSWGNGHATTYRGLVRELDRLGHEVWFLERDAPWYAANRDLPEPPFGHTRLYGSLEELRDAYRGLVRDADLVVAGSYVPDGIAVGEWVTATAQGLTAFYDIDTPVTLTKVAAGECEYLTPSLIARYEFYLSFTGGPTLQFLEQQYKAPRARPLYCSVDPEQYFPEPDATARYDLGYMGTYSEDRQPPLDRLLIQPACLWREGRFIVAGPQYPPSIAWPPNVRRIEHLPPAKHREFYTSQRFTLNITRADMVRAGWSPSVRLFEAAACAVPIVSDPWPGLGEIFEIGRELLVAERPEDVLTYLQDLPEEDARAIGEAGRQRVLASHTAAHRARELESYAAELLEVSP